MLLLWRKEIRQVKNRLGDLDVLEGNKDLRIQKVIQRLLQLTICTQEAVVKVTILCGVDPNKISSSLGLQQCLNNYLLRLYGQCHKLVQVLLLYPVQILDCFRLFKQCLDDCFLSCFLFIFHLDLATNSFP